MFTLNAMRGKIQTADGNSVPMWGYASAGGGYQYPSPFLCVNQGDTVTVILDNHLGGGVRTSITFPGQTGVKANGVPVTPEFSAGRMSSLTNSVADGETITYSFVAADPGTYLYQSGTDTAVQSQMGLFGGLIVRPSGNPGQLYGDAGSAFNRDHEYATLLSEVDPDLHVAVNTGQPYDMRTLRPRYWFINGRMFPDTIAPNGADWLPNQPYGALVRVQPMSSSNPLPAAIRYINASDIHHPFHPHGNQTRVLGVDGHRLQTATGDDLSTQQFLVDVKPGQTVDATWDWADVDHFSPVTNPVPVAVPDARDYRFTGDSWYSGTPYLGVKAPADELTTGVTSLNECGEYYMVAHSHALIEATTYGAAMGGQLTLYRIDPAGGCP